MKVAFVYDRVNKWGGAERVLLVLHELFPDAPLYTSVYNPETAPWAAAFPKVYTSFLQAFPFAKTSHEIYPYLMPIAFESFSFDEYDLVISVTSEAAKGVITKPKTIHVCYCLTPTRYLWSGYEDYFLSHLFRSITSPVVSYLRTWDRTAAQRPDYHIAISKEVQKRIKTYYERESEVIYPPVTLATSNQQLATSLSRSKTKRYSLVASDYFLIVSRLVPYKRTDVAVEAFNGLGWKLKIVGSGSELGRLKRMATRSNIEFLGNLTDRELLRYYEDCTALIVPGVEDFGLSAVEAQSFGKPVIALRKGGSAETIIEGKTGEFFYPQTSESLIKTLRMFNATKYKSGDCIRSVQRFSIKQFKEKFMEFIKKL